MNKFKVQGPVSLRGEVTISGAKNAAVAILPAAMLVDGVCIIENVPKISDVYNLIDIMDSLGAVTRWDGNTLYVDSKAIRGYTVDAEMARKCRASYYFMGALLGRFGKCVVPYPGGCSLGERPMDLHLNAFRAMQAEIHDDEFEGVVECNAPSLNGAEFRFIKVSVGATINAMLCACKAKGVTILKNVAKEPHVVDVANFLNSMGASVSGAGTNTIKIRGVARLGGGSYTVIPDQIEAGTYMIAAAATRGDILVKDVIPKHMECITDKLLEMGFGVEEFDDSIRVYYEGGELYPTEVVTSPYPGFPTDMQSQMGVLMATVKGESEIVERIWKNRFRYTDELCRMGAEISVENKERAVFKGGRGLRGASVHACDLRAGAALIIAACAAEGVTYMDEIEYVERGYEDVVQKFTALGANIEKITE